MHKIYKIERVAKEIQFTFFPFGVKIVKKSGKSTEPFSHTYVKSEAMSGYQNNWTTLNLGKRRAYESFLEIHGKVYGQNFIFPFHTRPFTFRG